ncbi:hypothetical protein [Microbulbifer spongiae]|uniref:Uncharacterized protein n=1 Tax=Microbulbifer spongiae TaxID=2944933 RepID=A0ABY9E945_9GAMM|nr:hypothetical protein [Microbulbifer sp. MI-G]WKD48970.1 hypothetical protein M8T91_13860 [Microbulbifer sp. MI-G]
MKYIVSVLFMLAINVHAADMKTVSGTINSIQFMGDDPSSYSTTGNAIALIHMDALPVSCDNSNGFRRVAITSDHPAYNSVVSGALASKASGQTVQLYYVEECTLRSSAWDFAILFIK